MPYAHPPRFRYIFRIIELQVKSKAIVDGSRANTKDFTVWFSGMKAYIFHLLSYIIYSFISLSLFSV